MWIYIFNVVTIPIYSKLIKNKKLFVFVVALQLFLILALRSSTLGVDLDNYSGGYEYIKGLGFDDLLSKIKLFGTADLIYPFDYESGYTVFNWISSHIGLNFHGFLVICAAINIFSISWFIYRYSKKPWLSFVIFSTFGFFMYDFGIIRQSLALSLFLLSFISFDRRKRIAGVLLFAIALTFHTVAVVAAPLLLLLCVKKITRKKYCVMLILTVPVLLLSGVIYSGIISSLMLLAGKGYVGHDVIINNMFLLLIAISLIVLIFNDFSRNEDKMGSIACYALLFAVYFSVFGLYNDVLARALQFYSVFLVILIPDIIDQYKDRKSIIVIELLVYVLLVGFMCYNISGSAINPYIIHQGGLLW